MLSERGTRAERIGYVVKRYPRHSETFIVTEILAHEAAGVEIEIFALRPPSDTHFQDCISKVRAPVTYIPYDGVKAGDFWMELKAAAAVLPSMWNGMPAAKDDEAINVFQAAVVARLVRERRITHLHSHFATSATSVARLAALFSAIPFSFTAHAKDIFHESVVAEDLARKLRDAAGTVTVSDFNLRFLSERYGDDASAVERIYNGLNLAEFAYASPADRPARIISVGRLVEKKGLDHLIKACRILKLRGRDFDCLIVGTGEREDVLREQIAVAGLESFVQLTGPRPQSEIKELVQNAAVFAAPCIVGSDGNRDGLPTVLLEAMALGTPCVSTDVTGIPEVLTNEETGLMVPQHDAQALADSLERLLTDAASRDRMATNARRRIEENFDISRNAALQRALFRRAGEGALSVGGGAV